MNRLNNMHPPQLLCILGISSLMTAMFIGCESTPRRSTLSTRSGSDRIELVEAKSRAAQRIAADALKARERGHIYTAMQWSITAARLDPDYQDLEIEMRELVVQAMLEEATTALEDDNMAQARLQAEHARELLPNSPSARDFVARLNHREATALVQQANEFVNHNDYAHAFEAISRASQLEPQNETITDTFDQIKSNHFARRYERIAGEFLFMLEKGDLDNSNNRLKQLHAIDIHQERTEILSNRLTEQQEQSKKLYDEGLIALVQDDHILAYETLAEALFLNQSLDPHPLEVAEYEIYREEFLDAMEQGDRLSAVLAANAMLVVRDDLEIYILALQVYDKLIEQTLTQAEVLTSEGKVEQAITTIDEILIHFDDPTLKAKRAELQQSIQRP